MDAGAEPHSGSVLVLDQAYPPDQIVAWISMIQSLYPASSLYIHRKMSCFRSKPCFTLAHPLAHTLTQSLVFDYK